MQKIIMMRKMKIGEKMREIVESIKVGLGTERAVVTKEILIGKKNYLDATVIYIQGFVDSRTIDETILKPLMLEVNEEELPETEVLEFLCKKYIISGQTVILEGLEEVVSHLIRGSTAIFINGIERVILVNTKGGNYRSIAETPNEATLRGTREGFVENLDVNITMLKRYVKDKKLKTEMYEIGERSKSDVCLAYIDDIVDKDMLKIAREKITNISTDMMPATGIIEQFVEESTYSPFPQAFGTERPDRIASKILEGRIAIFLSGTPYTITYPAILTEFFQSPEDYYERTFVSNITKMLRFIAAVIVVFLSPVYLTLISYNVELIPISFIIPLAESRQGIPLPPFFEILFMEIIVELIREGGLRLPPKVASTISIVGGIIIGNAAVESRVVSPTTLLIVGVSTVASFVIPNYEMAISLRVLKFPILLLAEALGFFGIAIGYFYLMVHIFSLKSMGVPYLTFTKQDMQDTLLRYPLFKMNNRPDSIPNNNPIRQGKTKEDRSNENG
jgi:spore germination protein KA